jgi:16S rRNA (guanine966-N2)-methyltransferase
MRVIGGTFGGRRLRALEGHATRPTSDRVREALFSRLEARFGLEGASVLDVFAGTGALAIEAISRGASRAVCIELDRRALETLRGNLREFELASKVRVMGDDYRRVLAKLAGQIGEAGAPPSASGPSRITSTRRRFDGVFLDPPYGRGLAVEALETVAHLGLVRPGGWVTVEVGRREPTPESVAAAEGTLVRVREDAYGDTLLALYEASSPASRVETVGDIPSPLETAGEFPSPAAEAGRR